MGSLYISINTMVVDDTSSQGIREHYIDLGPVIM